MIYYVAMSCQLVHIQNLTRRKLRKTVGKCCSSLYPISDNVRLILTTRGRIYRAVIIWAGEVNVGPVGFNDVHVLA